MRSNGTAQTIAGRFIGLEILEESPPLSKDEVYSTYKELCTKLRWTVRSTYPSLPPSPDFARDLARMMAMVVMVNKDDGRLG